MEDSGLDIEMGRFTKRQSCRGLSKSLIQDTFAFEDSHIVLSVICSFPNSVVLYVLSISLFTFSSLYVVFTGNIHLLTFVSNLYGFFLLKSPKYILSI